MIYSRARRSISGDDTFFFHFSGGDNFILEFLLQWQLSARVSSAYEKEIHGAVEA
jgi:hypothetical protein